jgi:hypothetical protein
MDDLAQKLDPRVLGYGDGLALIIGVILGHDYGVRDRKLGQLTGLSITSDGRVLAACTARKGKFLVGSAEGLETKLALLVSAAKLNDQERAEVNSCYRKAVAWAA